MYLRLMYSEKSEHKILITLQIDYQCRTVYTFCEGADKKIHRTAGVRGFV